MATLAQRLSDAESLWFSAFDMAQELRRLAVANDGRVDDYDALVLALKRRCKRLVDVFDQLRVELGPELVAKPPLLLFGAEAIFETLPAGRVVQYSLADDFEEIGPRVIETADGRWLYCLCALEKFDGLGAFHETDEEEKVSGTVCRNGS